jgi:hypothetical protein
MNKPLTSLVIPLAGMVIGYTLISLLILGEVRLLEQYVTPREGMDMPAWLPEMERFLIRWTQWPAAIAGFVWLATTFVHSGIRTDLRLWWAILWAICIGIAFGLAFFQMPETASSRLLPLGVTVANGFLGFYVITAAWSISTHKFAPLGSMALRRAF